MHMFEMVQLLSSTLFGLINRYLKDGNINNVVNVEHYISMIVSCTLMKPQMQEAYGASGYFLEAEANKKKPS